MMPMSRSCLHKDQLFQDPLTFKQNSSYVLFCFFFHYIFSFFFAVSVVHPHLDHPITTVFSFLHSLANRHSCSTSAEMQDRKCFSMQLILVVGKVDMINQICQMLSFC